MNTQSDPRPEEARQISLNKSETIALKRPQTGEGIELKVKTESYGLQRVNPRTRKI